MSTGRRGKQELVPFALVSIEGLENGPSNLLYAKELLGDSVELRGSKNPSLRGVTTPENITFMREQLFPGIVDVVTFEDGPDAAGSRED